MNYPIAVLVDQIFPFLILLPTYIDTIAIKDPIIPFNISALVSDIAIPDIAGVMVEISTTIQTVVTIIKMQISSISSFFTGNNIYLVIPCEISIF